MNPLRKVGRLSSIVCSVIVAFAYILPTTMAGEGGMAGGAIAAGYFLVPMTAAAIIAVSTAIWGWMESSRRKQPFESILVAPLIIVVGGVAMLFVGAALRDAL